MRMGAGTALRRGVTLMVGALLAASVFASPVLAGTGAHLTITPTSWNYGSTNAGTPDGTQTFTVKNTGTVQSSSPITTSLSNLADFTKTSDTCNASSLGPGATCTMDVQFTPAASASGNRTATLKAVATTGGTASAKLTGTALNAQLTISPSSWNFGSVQVNLSSAPQTFTVTNVGPLKSGTITFGISGAIADFSAAGSGGTPCITAVTTLDAGLSCTIDATFNPASAGNKNAKLNVSASPGGAVAASLFGTGLPWVLGTDVMVWFVGPSTDCSSSAANWEGTNFTNLVLDLVLSGTCQSGSASPQATITISPDCSGDNENVSCFFGSLGLTRLAFDHKIGTYCQGGSPGWDVEGGGNVYRFACSGGTHVNLKNGWERITFTNADAQTLAGVPFTGFSTGFKPTFLQVLQDEGGCTVLANLRINNTVIKTGTNTGGATC